MTSRAARSDGRRADRPRQLEPVHLGHLAVEHDELVRLAAARPRRASRQRLGAAGGLGRSTPRGAQLGLEDRRGWSRCRRRRARAGRRAARRARGGAARRVVGSPSAHGEPERAALARRRARRRSRRPSARRAGARSPGRGRCRRSGGWSSVGLGEGARTAASSASRRRCRCRCRCTSKRSTRPPLGRRLDAHATTSPAR